MKALDALFRSEKSGGWEKVTKDGILASWRSRIRAGRNLRGGAQGVLHGRFDGLRQPAETLLRRYFEQSETLNILQPPDVRSARVGRSFLRMAKRHAHS